VGKKLRVESDTGKNEGSQEKFRNKIEKKKREKVVFPSATQKVANSTADCAGSLRNTGER